MALDGIDERLSTCYATTSARPHEPAAADLHTTKGRSRHLPLSADSTRTTRLPAPATIPAATVHKDPAAADASLRGTTCELVLAQHGRIPADSLKLDGDHHLPDLLRAPEPEAQNVTTRHLVHPKTNHPNTPDTQPPATPARKTIITNPKRHTTSRKAAPTPYQSIDWTVPANGGAGEFLGRLRSDRVMRRPTRPRVGVPKGGRPLKHGGEFVFGDPATWGTEQAVTTASTRLYGKATAQAWDWLHPRLTRRADWIDHDGPFPIIEGTVITLGGVLRPPARARLGSSVVSRRPWGVRGQ